MASTKSYKLHVVFGEEASSHASRLKMSTVRKKLKEGALEGSFQTYSFSTAEDRRMAISLLDDADGWGGTYYETEDPKNQ